MPLNNIKNSNYEKSKEYVGFLIDFLQSHYFPWKFYSCWSDRFQLSINLTNLHMQNTV